ncbi:MAG: DUF2828 family protein [Ruminococcus sp.]|nr:DUF2828 family protein [Ruminococcus sp.]
MSKFLDALKQQSNITTTENGAYTYCSTLSDCLDLFYRIGALRHVSESDITSLIERAYAENKDYTFRIIFFARDVRGGLGERRVFRIAMKYLAVTHTESVIKNLNLFSEYGRWDDLITLYSTDVESIKKNILQIVRLQLRLDAQGMKDGKNISLLAKWLPSINASKNATITLAKEISKGLNMSYKTYRQTLSSLRKYIDILENRLRTKDYTFEYSKQPAKAMLQYQKAFIRNDGERYMKYLESVSRGDSTINTGTLYPYDIVRKVFNNDEIYISNEERKSLDVTWNALPNVSNNKNSIAVIDGSASMYWSYLSYVKDATLLPYQVAISLGLYFAEHSNGAFANHFITFSSMPRLIEVKGNDIVDKINYVKSFNECSNTNVQAVFDLILNTALSKKLSQNELPETIYIISDMEFDNCVYSGNKPCTNFEQARNNFKYAGYTLPNVVFWNVASRNEQVPVKAHQSGALLVSGFSAKVFDMVQSGNLNPEMFMLEIINGDRYNRICA